MTWLPRWLTRPITGPREARRHLEQAEADRDDVRELAAELRRHRAENHITSRVHRAMRGGST
jgi:hypothetical protein